MHFIDALGSKLNALIKASNRVCSYYYFYLNRAIFVDFITAVITAKIVLELFREWKSRIKGRPGFPLSRE
jgi:hypothetical protein